MKENKSKARMQALKELKDAMSSDMKNGYEKMTVMAPDRPSLEKGLEMGKEILGKLPNKSPDSEGSEEAMMDIPEGESDEMLPMEEMELESEEEMESDELSEDDMKLFEMFKKFMKQHKEEM
jgi:hypothetical protein